MITFSVITLSGFHFYCSKKIVFLLLLYHRNLFKSWNDKIVTIIGSHKMTWNNVLQFYRVKEAFESVAEGVNISSTDNQDFLDLCERVNKVNEKTSLWFRLIFRQLETITYVVVKSIYCWYFGFEHHSTFLIQDVPIDWYSLTQISIKWFFGVLNLAIFILLC